MSPKVGLKNLGHTCFLNSVAQIFIELPGVSDLFIEEAVERYVPSLDDLRNTHNNMKQLYLERLINALKGALHTGYRGRARSASSFLERLLAEASSSSSSSEEVNLAIEPSVYEHLLKLKQAVTMTEESSYSPLSFYLGFLAINPQAEAFRQHDVAEFYHFLVDRMHSEFVSAVQPRSIHVVTFSKNDKSPFSHYFKGTIITDHACKACGYSRSIEAPFIDLVLEIPTTKIPLIMQHTKKFAAAAFNLEDCISSFFDPPSGVEPCSACNRADTLQTSLFFGEAPQILVLNLGRANFVQGRGATKNRTFVDVPEHLQLSGLLRSPVPCGYSLAGAVLHHGTGSESGHYTCYTKKEEKWVHCNDTDLEPLKGGYTIEDALRSLPQSTSQPCLLFYARKKDERNKLPLLQNFRNKP